MYRKHDGFSLIELMVSVSIIGILAVIAIPSYQTYTKRARFAEVISAADFFKITVALAIQQGTPLGEIKNGAHGIPAKPNPTRNLADLHVKNGIITATATELADKSSYILKPSEDGSNWIIGGTCLKNGYCNE